MKTYTEQELLKAVEYACGYQKACSYQEIGGVIADGEDHKCTHDEIMAFILDNLCDTDKNCAKKITIEDINEYLNS